MLHEWLKSNGNYSELDKFCLGVEFYQEGSATKYKKNLKLA